MNSAAFRAKWEQKCPDCGARDLVEDRAAGDLICRVCGMNVDNQAPVYSTHHTPITKHQDCGMVLEAHAIDETSEWRTFADSVRIIISHS